MLTTGHLNQTQTYEPMRFRDGHHAADFLGAVNAGYIDPYPGRASDIDRAKKLVGGAVWHLSAKRVDCMNLRVAGSYGRSAGRRKGARR